ncbi:MAG TPA: carboxypeptidase regulatory-like domain-containing protein, partial [Pyrinomonadaceae bacterium]|nr:carboxypeptidase regulatory-like domain-containing protein [Pyrinomonadaceae bacterium]
MHSQSFTPSTPLPFPLLRVAVALLCLAAAAGVARAQTTTSTLNGDIIDANGAVIQGVEVTARHLDTGLSRTTTSDAEGHYVFPGLPLGPFEVRAAKAGFKQYVYERINLTVGETAALDITMEVAGPEQEQLTVTADAALVNTQTPELSYLVGERAIEQLPLNGRNYTDLALLQPGVIAYPHRDGGSVVAHGVGASINGQDPRSNVYLIDGTPQNDFTNGPAGSAAGTVLGIEAIREFRVETNAYSAEYGRNSGGQINAVSKSGTNNFHGSLYEFHRNDNFDARNFFDGAQKPEFRRNQFGGSIGGPIKQDQLFFFGAFEALRENLGRTVSTVVPDLASRSGPVHPAIRPFLDEFPLPNGRNLGSGLAAYSFGFDQTISQNFIQG